MFYNGKHFKLENLYIYIYFLIPFIINGHIFARVSLGYFIISKTIFLFHIKREILFIYILNNKEFHYKKKK